MPQMRSQSGSLPQGDVSVELLLCIRISHGFRTADADLSIGLPDNEF